MGIFTKVIGHRVRSGDRKRQRRNFAIGQRLALNATVQARRRFLRQARGAIAQNLVAGGAREGGIESSGFQGAAASLATQREAEVFRSQVEQRDRNLISSNQQRTVERQSFNMKATELGGVFDQILSSQAGGGSGGGGGFGNFMSGLGSSS